MIEKIGKVELDLKYYSGNDLYSDGEIEDVLLSIVSSFEEDEFDNIISEYSSWPILYHLSTIRQNIISWYPITKEDNVLEIGAGCGAITGALSKLANKVVAIELSKKRSTINAYRNKDKNNIEIMVGNFNDIQKNIDKKFDYITLIGVFEYAESYIEEENPYIVFLDKINELLNENGKIIIAIENRFGLKYFAGCKEDHVDLFYEGIEGYHRTKGVKTFNKFEINELLKVAGFKDIKFYYPYPDYKLPTTIYSDEYLPKIGELNNNIRNFDSNRYVMFDETKAFDGIIQSEMFPEFSNSFLIEIPKKER